MSAAAEAGQRERVLLLHSSASSAQQWNALVQALEPQHEVHAIDLHGHGTGPEWSATRPMRLADDARLARRLVEAGRGVHLVGHSYGGAVALHLAARWPQFVRSVVVYEPVAFCLLGEMLPHAEVTRGVHELGAFMRAAAARGDADAAARRFIDFWSGAGSWEQLPPHRREGFARRVPALLAHFGALWAEPWPRELEEASAPPLLVLSGETSNPTAHTLAALLRQRLPHARHRALPGLAHMAPITDAAAFNAQVVEFLREQRTARRGLRRAA